MTVLLQPDSLSLCGNLKPFKISAGATVNFTLKDGATVLVAATYEPGSDGIVTIDVRDIVESRLSYQLKSENFYEQTSIVKTFTASIDGSDISFRVIRAGVANLSDTPSNWLRSNFLTWQPQKKAVTYYTPEWLTLYAVEACTLKMKAHFPDNTEQNVTIGSCSVGKAFTANVQYAVIAGLLGQKYPDYYDIWAENSSGIRLTYIQRYYYSDPLSEQEQWFLFENSLGGMDTIRAYGDTDFEGAHEHQIAVSGEQNIEYRIDTERKYTKNTGSLTDYERRWLLDFFPAKSKYIHVDFVIRPIVMIDSDVKYAASELPSSYNFTYKFTEVSSLLNLVRNPDDLTPVITLPNLDSPDFILPPRLSEYPRVQLHEGVIIPVSDPNSDQMLITTIGAIVDRATETTLSQLPGYSSGGQLVKIIKENDTFPATDNNVFSSLRILKEIGNVGQSSHTHDNKSILDKLSQENIDVLSKLSLDENDKLKVDTDLYSVGEVSAYGAGTSGGGGGSSYNRLDSWLDYTPDKSGWVLSALLGNDLNNRVSSLEGGSLLNISTTGTGNAITSISKSGNSLLFTKGSSFALESHTHSNYLLTSLKGTANGLAELDANGFVPSSQLPSYVDDVLEFSDLASFPATGATGKIYVALDKNLTYRWSGSAYVEISASLALGETSSTAYRGDRGKIAYDHSQIAGGVHVISTERTNWNLAYTNSHTHSNKTIIDQLSQSNLDVLALLSVDNGKLKINADTYSTGEISAYGVGEGGDGSASYNRLDAWADYTSDKAGWVLSALLGNDLNSRVTSLEGGSATSISVTGSGNAVTNVSKSGNTLTFTKGLTFSESNHNHDGVYLKTETDPIFSAHTVKNIVNGVGFLKNSNGTWSYDNSTYSLSSHNHSGVYEPLITKSTGYLYYTGSAWSFKNESYSLSTHNHSGVYQPLDADLTAIVALSGTTGLLRKTAANTWSLDTNAYLTGNQTITISGDATGSGSTSIALTLANSGVTAGTYNNVATQVRPFTVDAKGRITSIGTAVTIAPAWGNITSKPTTVAGYGITDAYTKTEVNTALALKLDKSVFDDLFEKVEISTGVYAIKAKYNFYSIGEVSAFGAGSGSGGGSSYNRLDAWADYSSDKSGWVLSALLGNDLNTRVTSLESGSALNITTTGTGNAVTAISKSGNTITATKGSIFSVDGHTHTKSQITDFPTSMPASDVYAWAKAATKPTYTYTEVGAAAASHTHSYLSVPDTRSIVPAPQDLISRSLQVDFKFNTSVNNPPTAASSAYSHIISFTGWSATEGSGGWPSQLSIGDGIAVRQATSATTWGTWRNVYHTGNLSVVTTSVNGLMSAADKTKLDGISAGARPGTVTSVAMTVPTGLSISGSPITTSGTLALSLASGYSIPTTAKQTQWDTAYTHSQSAHAYLPLSGGTMSNTNLVANLNADLLDGLHSTKFMYLYRLNSDISDIDIVGNTYIFAKDDIGYTLGTKPPGSHNGVGIISLHTHIGNYATQLALSTSTNDLFIRSANAVTEFGVWEKIYHTGNLTNLSQLNNNVGFITSSASITGNASSATQLQTARTIWGQSFDGTGNVDGDLTNVGSITANGNITTLGLIGVKRTPIYGTLEVAGVIRGNNESDTIDTLTWEAVNSNYILVSSAGWWGIRAGTNHSFNIDTNNGFPTINALTILTSGNVGIGNSNPLYKLDVSGKGRFTGDVTAPTFVGALSGNASTATKLQTARTIWGQSFDGTGNVDGDLTNVGSITANGNITTLGLIGVKRTPIYGTLEVAGVIRGNNESDTIDTLTWEAVNSNYILVSSAGWWGIRAGTNHSFNIDTHNGFPTINALTILTSGNVGIGNSNPLYKLDVSGTGRFTGNLTVPRVIFAAAGWSVEQSGTEIQFKYNGTIKQRLLSDGSIVAVGEVTAYGATS